MLLLLFLCATASDRFVATLEKFQEVVDMTASISSSLVEVVGVISSPSPD
jgi:hypothetical protein